MAHISICIHETFRKICVHTGLLALVLLTPTLIANISWNHYSATQSSGASYKESFPGAADLVHVPRYFLANPDTAISEFITSFSAQVGLTTSRGFNGSSMHQNLPPIYENQVISVRSYSADRSCGLLDWVNHEKWVQYAQSEWKPFCSIGKLPNWIFRTLQSLSVIFLFIFACWPVVMIHRLLGFFRRKKDALTWQNLILSLPIGFVLVSYLLLGAQPDRYAVPYYLPFTLSLVLLISKAEWDVDGKRLT